MVALPENPAVNLLYRRDSKGESYEVLIGYYENGHFFTCEESNSVDFPNLRIKNIRNYSLIKEELGKILNGAVKGELKLFINDKLVSN
ncbi:MAG: hypothetical protein QXI33_01155 [Candidatus Pacearchaeota archaeon]